MIIRTLKTGLLLLLFAGAATAQAQLVSRFSYDLAPYPVAEDTYVLIGESEDFSLTNGANIVNIAFVVTSEGVVLIDSGPSVRYARQLEAAIQAITDKPIIAVIVTHHHPDHWFGNQHFVDVPIYALEATRTAMALEGNNFADNLYRMSGDWMRDTEPALANRTIDTDVLEFGEHRFQLFPLTGHTVGDLALLDESTGVLFAGDLVFNQRAPTTPHATIAAWLASLEELAALDYKVIVPGHGPVATDETPIRFTRNYLLWLDETMRYGAQRGDTMTEIMRTPVPGLFSDTALIREELARTVVHLYAGYEDAFLPMIAEGEY